MINEACGRVVYPDDGTNDEQGGLVLDLIHMAYSGWSQMSMLLGKPVALADQESSL